MRVLKTPLSLVLTFFTVFHLQVPHFFLRIFTFWLA